MKIGLSFIPQIRALPGGGFLAETVNDLTASVSGGYHTEHHDDDTHSDVHAETLALSAQPRCSAYHSTTQSIPDNAFTAVVFDTDEYNIGGFHSTVSNTSRFPVPSSGHFMVSAIVSFRGNATGQRIIKLVKTGADFPGNGYILGNTGAVFDTGLSFTVGINAIAGDYFEVQVYQNSGGALNIGGTLSYVQSRFNIVKLG